MNLQQGHEHFGAHRSEESLNTHPNDTFDRKEEKISFQALKLMCFERMGQRGTEPGAPAACGLRKHSSNEEMESPARP